MINFEQALEARLKAKEMDQKRADHFDRLTYQVFYENPLGREWLTAYIGAMLQPLTQEQMQNLHFYEGTQQPYKRIIEAISRHKSKGEK